MTAVATRTSTRTMPAVAPKRCAVEPVGKNGRQREGWCAHCLNCNWSSFRYDQEATAELVAKTHDERCGPQSTLALTHR